MSISLGFKIIPFAVEVIQPTNGQDTFMYAAQPTTNQGNDVHLYTGNTANKLRSLIKFDFSILDSSAILTAPVTFSLYEDSAAGGSSRNVDLNRVLRNWIEVQATWNVYSTGNSWTTGGAGTGGSDVDVDISATVTLDGSAAAAYIDWEGAVLSDDVQAYINGTYTNNYGWRLKSTVETSGNWNGFHSSDWDDVNDPKIVVTYTIPNATPINDVVTIIDLDDGGNIYSQQEYIVTLNSSDADGASEIQNISLGFTDSSTWFNMTADTSEASVSVSITSGIGTWWISSPTNVTSGNTQNVTFQFRINWNATDALNIELYMKTCDSIECTAWEEKRSNYADIETDITQSNFALNDDRGNPSVTLTATWTITYEGSAVKPPDGNFTTGCIVHNPAHASQGTATTPATGICTVNDITASSNVEIITYHPYMNGGGQYPDADVGATTDTYISDKKNVTITIGETPIDVGVNASISVTAVNVYDGSASDSTLNLNYTIFIHYFPVIKTYTVASVDSDGTYGITVIDVNDVKSVEWEVTIGELRSVEDLINNDTTTNSIYEDVNDLSVNITIPFQSNILIMASIQTESNISAVASYPLVFDGINYQGLRRQVSTLAGNIVLTDLVYDKPVGNYELKLQHSISAGKLSTINTTIYAIMMHNGNGEVPSNDTFVNTASTTSSTLEDISGLSTEITLARTSYVWFSMSWSGEMSVANQQGNFTIDIDGQTLETRFRKWGTSNEWGALSLITRTNDKIPNGTHTVKGVWQRSNAGTLSGLNFSLVVIGGEANGTVAEFDISKSRVVTNNTSSTSLENIVGSTYNVSLPDTSYIIGFLSLDSETNVNNKNVYFTVNINGTDQTILKRGHSSAGSSIASIGQIVRTNNTLSTGIANLTGRWFTDAGTVITGENIILTSFILFTNDTGTVDLTVYRHTGLTQIFVGGDPTNNGTVIKVTIFDTVNITMVEDIGYDFFRTDFSPINSHTHINPYFLFMNVDVISHSYALAIGAAEDLSFVLPNNQDNMTYIYLGIIISALISISIAIYAIRKR